MEKNRINGGTSFDFKMAGGLSWSLTATSDAEGWLIKMVHIMGLNSGFSHNVPHIIFCRSELDGKYQSESIKRLNEKVSLALPKEGWQIYKHDFLEFWVHGEMDHTVIDLGEKINDDVEILRMSEIVLFFYREALKVGGLPLHAVLLECDRCGVLLAARGGEGKSTCARRRPLSWNALSDDHAFVIRDARGHYVAHPFPTWSDYLWRRSERTWDVARPVSLSGIFFLEQSKTDEAFPIGRSKAAALIYRSAMQVYGRFLNTFGRDEKRRHSVQIFQNACDLAEALPAYKLRASLTGRFWEKIEEVLKMGPSMKGKKEESEGVVYESRSDTEALRS